MLAPCPFHADLVPILVHVHHKPWPRLHQQKCQPPNQLKHHRRKHTRMKLNLHLKILQTLGMTSHGSVSQMAPGFNFQTFRHITRLKRWIDFGSIGSLPTRTKPASPTPWTTFDVVLQARPCSNIRYIALCRHGTTITFNLVWSTSGDHSTNQPPDRYCHGIIESYNKVGFTPCRKQVILLVNQFSLSSTISIWLKPGAAPVTKLYQINHPRLPVGTPLWTCGTH